MAKYNRCTRTDCLHHKGTFGCHLLSQLYDDENKCKFFCDSNKYYFTHTDYHGVKCTYISEYKGEQNNEQRTV